jgi:hypothetical protein
MRRALPWLLVALAACEPREGPAGPEVEASPPVAPAPPPIAPLPVAPAPIAPPAATPIPGPTPSAAPAAAGPVRCGDQQCGPTQICIEAQIPPSAQPKSGPVAATFTCTNEPMKGAGFKCDEPKDRHQRCVALTADVPH